MPKSKLLPVSKAPEGGNQRDGAISTDSAGGTGDTTRRLTAESRYQSLVTAASAIVYQCTSDGQFGLPQPSWEAFTGQNWEQHKGFGWSDMIHPDDRAAAAAALVLSVTTDVPYRASLRLWCAETADHHRCQFSAAGTKDIHGVVFEWVGMIADMEQSIRHTEQLYEDQRRLALSIKAAEIGTFHCAVPVGIVDLNDQCKTHFWLSTQEEVSLERFFAIIYLEDRHAAKDAIATALTDGKPFDLEYRTVSPNGDLRWLRAKGSAYHNASGVPIRFDGITIDISEQKTLQAQRDRLLERERLEKAAAQNASHLKDAFLARVSHELRTPLNAVQSWAFLLGQNRQDANVFADALDAIDRNVRLQSKLVDDLLDTSLIASGTLFLNMEPVRLTDLVKNAVEDVQHRALSKQVHITFVEDDTIVMGDKIRLQQAVANLLDNAVKYSFLQGLVTVRLTRAGSQVKLTFTDGGRGIRPDFLRHLFEPFAQADDAITRRDEGLGIGLAIAKNIVDLHGGSIIGRSDGVDLGSEFVITLPAAARASLLNDAGESNKPVALQSKAKCLDSLRILIVEDHADTLEAMSAVFESEGAIVSRASSASAARQLLLSQHYDLITSDIGMPGEDGYLLMQWIRGQNITTPSVAITAFTRPEDEAHVYQAGFDRYHPKPIAPAMLFDAMVGLLQRT